MTIMAVCSLNYDYLVKAVEEKKCLEAIRLSESPLNKHALFLRNGGVTYCYGRGCPFALTRRVKVEFKEQRYKLEITEIEKAMIEKRDWKFLLDRSWVDHNIFSPSGSFNDVGWTEYREGYAIPMRPIKFFAEDEDIIVFEDYDEYGDEEIYTKPPKLKELSGRQRLLYERLNRAKNTKVTPYSTDRFCTFSKSDLDWDSTPVGVIIKNPKNTPLSILDERFNRLRWGVMGDYITNELPKHAGWELEAKLSEDEITEIIKNPESIREHLRTHRIYLSSYHKSQTKLNDVIKEMVIA